MKIPPQSPPANSQSFPPYDGNWDTIAGQASSLVWCFYQFYPNEAGGAIGAKIRQGDYMDPGSFNTQKQGWQQYMSRILAAMKNLPSSDPCPTSLINQLNQDINNLTPQSNLEDFISIGGEANSLYQIANQAYAGKELVYSSPLNCMSNLTALTSAMSPQEDPQDLEDWGEAVKQLSQQVSGLSSMAQYLNANDLQTFKTAYND